MTLAELITALDANPHAAPNRRYTVTEARAVTQDHRGCCSRHCPNKRAAQSVLVEEGVWRPYLHTYPALDERMSERRHR